MQKRKGLYCGSRRLTLVAGFIAGQAAASAMSVAAASLWGEAPFGACSELHLSRSPGSTRTAVFILRLANPYSIDGLVAARLEAEFDARTAAARVDWSRISHPLYGEDFLSCSTVVPLAGPGIVAGAEGAVLRRRVSGFPEEGSSSLRFIAGFRRGSSASLIVALPLALGGSGPPGRPAWSCRFSLGAFAAALSRFSPDGVETECRFDMRARLGERIAAGTAYGIRSGELTCGLLVDVRRLLLGFSWSVHPSLGLSASAGAGRRWSW